MSLTKFEGLILVFQNSFLFSSPQPSKTEELFWFSPSSRTLVEFYHRCLQALETVWNLDFQFSLPGQEESDSSREELLKARNLFISATEVEEASIIFLPLEFSRLSSSPARQMKRTRHMLNLSNSITATCIHAHIDFLRIPMCIYGFRDICEKISNQSKETWVSTYHFFICIMYPRRREILKVKQPRFSRFSHQ